MNLELEFEEESITDTIKEKVGNYILQQLLKGEAPEFKIIKRDMSNVSFGKEEGYLLLGDKTLTRKMRSLSEIRGFTQTLFVANTLRKSILDGYHITLRDVFYHNLFTIPGSKRLLLESQEESNAIVQDLELITGISREKLRIVADSKGLLVGDIQFKSEGDILDGSKMGSLSLPIPSIVDDLEFLKTNAEFVLVVEKGAIFEGLSRSKWWKKNNCLLVTGKGQPDRGTRRMVNRLNNEFDLPVYVLVDGDSYGFTIYGVYKYGSVSLAYQNDRLTCPDAQFLGVSVSDIYNYKIPKSAIIQANKTDLKRAEDMMKTKWFGESDFWKKEIELLLKKKEKIELEAFSRFGFNYLADTYIPEKIFQCKKK